MVGFIIPIPGKVIDGVYDKGSQFVNSYKKQPVATDLSARQGSMDEKTPVPAPPTRKGSTSQPPAYTPSSRQPAQQPRGRSEDFGPQLLDHVLSSLALLQSLGQITPEAAKRAAAALGSDYDPHSVTLRETPRAPAASAVAPPPARRQNSASAEKRATALWDYGQNGDEDDLVFSAGDTIIIDEEENENWCRGRTIPKGRTVPLPKKGLFPANYVQRH
ncbi:actin filament organization-related protein [Trichosporon asahii var. asahii CBS 8904]|uniref:Actin filament organization-related protein n=2 Tax=Trichosporon asahii var. asahii TaxID=189963 RepID=K1VZT4_TRIAC|nr:actin filament organization-related protein [Trichosporon asahii var. asahii CBS 2479]EJT53114.1 actin filament organization-related protein [Trichosporon asahii var. asahii CBS 2479]EKD02318.1 actin filament organization-related protein [Trichosporon asahii var. asahii CBS 8904]